MRLAGGNALSQVIIMVGMPFLTRKYSASEFGALALVNSALLVIGVIGSGRYDQLMYNYSTQEEHLKCYSNGLFICLILSTLVLLLSIFFFVAYEIEEMFLLLSPLVFTFTIYQLYVSLFTLIGDYNYIIKGNLIKATLLIFFQYSLAPFGANGLVVGQLLAQLISLIVVVYSYHLHFPTKVILNVRLLDYKNALFSSFQSLSNSISSQLPVAFIPFFFGMNSLGYYSLASRLTQLPITFFSNAIRPFILRELNTYKRDCLQTKKIVVYGSLFLLLLGVIGIFLIHIFAVDFFCFYAGKTWSSSGEIASFLSLWAMLAFANVVSVSYLTVSAKFSFLFLYDFILLMSRLLVIVFVFYFSCNFLFFVSSYSMVGMMFNLYLICYGVSLVIRNE